MPNSPRHSTRPGLSWSKLLTEEPFRVFFPLSVLASVVGVALWPMVYSGWLHYFPGEAHARLMIQGFVGGAALGFLGTAFPRMVEAPALSGIELLLLLLTYLGTVASHAIGATAFGDGFFLLTWVLLGGFLGVRLAFLRKSLPPPGFILVALGIAAAIVGTVILCCGRIIRLVPEQRAFADLLLHEAFITGPILGIGSILFARFFPAGDGTPARRRPLSVAAAAIVSLALIATYIAQAFYFSSSAPILRGLIILAVLLYYFPFLLWRRTPDNLSLFLRVALACLVVGILVPTMFERRPIVQSALKHVLFIGSYGLLILGIGSRVILGHSGNLHLVKKLPRTFKLIFGTVFLALLTRIVADFIPTIRVSHHIYAALAWILAVGVWSWAVLHYVRTPDPEDDEGEHEENDRPCQERQHPPKVPT